ncbi:hypothetical protein Tco_0748178 [Tanacetum coccineum]|uniref:UBN2 domain-containing protein n=1 Tax=Tanacetum coccineum TaxID=301880 RepID=A0ABQ4YXL3_9ASTR
MPYRVKSTSESSEVWHTLIITHQGNSLVKDCKLIFSLNNMRSSQSQVKKLLIAASQDSMILSQVMTIEEAKDLGTLPLDNLIGNLKATEIALVTKEVKALDKAWSDSEDGDEPQNDTTCLMAIDSQVVQTKPSTSNNDLDFIELQKENEELLIFNRDFIKTFEKLLKEKRSLKSGKSRLLIKINDLEFEVKKLINDKEVVEPCKKCDILTKRLTL